MRRPLQEASQLLDAVAIPTLDRVDREIQLTGDLAKRQLSMDVQGDHLALFGRQLGQRLEDLRRFLRDGQPVRGTIAIVGTIRLVSEWHGSS